MAARFASTRGSSRAPAAPNQRAGSNESVMFALPAPTTKLPSFFWAAESEEVKVNACPRKTQRAWDHSVPKVARAGPRISVAYRYGLAIAKEASDEY